MTFKTWVLALGIGICLSAADQPVEKTTVDGWMRELSNWGRWGKNDQLGTVNLITPAKRKAAALLVKEGYTVSLSSDAETVKSADNEFPFGHQMIATGLDPNPMFGMDIYTARYHGKVLTHMDALSHMFYQGKMYNGYSQQQVDRQGAQQLAVTAFKNGLVSRGILIDIPLLRNVKYLELSTPVYPADLDAWEKKAGVKVGSGDIVFIRTGRWARRAEKGPWDTETAAAGMHVTCARWFHQRDVAMVGSDTHGELMPPPVKGVAFPMHQLLLVAMGTPMFDNCDLEALSQAAAARHRWEFLLTAAPLAVPQGTGSPLNPIAVLGFHADWKRRKRLKPILFASAIYAASVVVLLSQTSNGRVERLLSQMTLAEKIAMIHGAPEDPATSQGQPGYVPGVPRLGIPALRLVDGPPGVLTKVWSTGMTSTMGLAATFSREDARKNGEVIGGDARALGQDIVLEPFLNLVRDFGFARAYNTYGEDPLLAGQIGAAVVRGIQSRGVMSAAKHYTAFDGSADVSVDAQTFHEIYLAPFADAVEAGIASVLCSSNRINGVYSCGSGATLNGVLKTELAFQGFVIPDFEGTHSTLYINQGLDLEMPGGVEGVPTGRGGYFLANAPPPVVNSAGGRAGGRGANAPGGMPEERSAVRGGGRGAVAAGGTPTEAPMGMLRAIETGKVQEATITTAVRRILNQMERFGYLEKGTKHDVTPIDHDFNLPVLQKTAEDAAVLLKNAKNALPLSAGDLESTVLIGPGAGQTIAIGLPGGKGTGIPSHQVGTVAALENLTGKRVRFAVANDMTGTPVPAEALSLEGLTGELNFTLANGRALPPGTSRTWSGVLTAPAEGSYMLALQVLGAAATMNLDGQPVLRTAAPGRGGVLHPVQDNILPTTDGLDNARTFAPLTAGAHQITVAATGEQAGQPVQVRLAWVTPPQQRANREAAIAAAREATKAVIFAWGRDRPEVFRLPGDQDQLIQDIAAVNPNTIVVLNTSFPVAMPWLDRVQAVLQMWWPGDRGGPATANLLLGRANPAGRLPFTWPRSLDQMLANDPVHPERSNAGVEGRTAYSEGIFMGYRWFDKQDLAPLFPFGHGLSYASFVYSKLRVMGAPDGGFDVSFAVRNAGRLAGDEVPQVYLGPPEPLPADGQFAVRALAAFDRVSIGAGQSKNVVLHVPLRRLQYWPVSKNRWVTAAGRRRIYVGASSRDARLTGGATIEAR